jgi:amino acid transporter
VYAWVQEAFGDKSGFIAIFCEWPNNLVWFPTLPFIATVVLLFAGMEMAGFHALEVCNPQKDFPKGMLLSALIIFVLTVVGTLAIAIVVPVSELNLAAGLMQAFQAFLTAFGLDALLAPLVILVALGGVALLASWLIGPALGLGVVAEEGLMTPLFSRRNKNGSPTGVMILQAVIGTIISLL